MSLDGEKLNSEKAGAESILISIHLREFVKRLLRTRVFNISDAEDISQNVFRRSWQWANKNNKQLYVEEWKSLLARIAFNEINRFYSKRVDLLAEDLLPEETALEISTITVNPQFILEIAEVLGKLPLRQKLSVVFNSGEILPYLKIVLPDRYIADMLGISHETLLLLESELPLSDNRITEIIELLTQKPCKSSIRDERCKGRKALRSRLFGK